MNEALGDYSRTTDISWDMWKPCVLGAIRGLWKQILLQLESQGAAVSMNRGGGGVALEESRRVSAGYSPSRRKGEMVPALLCLLAQWAQSSKS